MGLSQTDATRHLNVSRKFVQTLELVLKRKFNYKIVLRRPRVINPSDDASFSPNKEYLYFQFFNHSTETGRRISSTTVRRHLHNLGIYALYHFCVFFSSDHRDFHDYVGPESKSLGPENSGAQNLYRYRPFLSCSRRLNHWLENTSGLKGPYSGAIGDDFMLIDDNARSFHAIHNLVNKYLENQNLERMDWSS
ncbi:hypothetical protein AVEN_197010-1 [Araneus ventricosus]|uniref:Uncharacterized protein n=1 Tax=Araneus ventricosus TaxID=182803 RepID=A0A4Y2EAT5_ARAVE|nr:hypothetical protein AVEN_197010-1 [Araneus ventricosus]